MTTSRPGRPRRPDVDAGIERAALSLVAEHGFAAVTMDAIAAAAGVSKPTVYRRWPGKLDLVVAALRRRVAALTDVPDVDTGSLRGDLVGMFTGAMDAMAGDERLALGLAAALPAHPELAAAVRELSDTYTARRTAAVVARAVARGELAPDPDRATFVLTAAAALFLGHVATAGAPADPAYVARVVDELLLPALTDRRNP